MKAVRMLVYGIGEVLCCEEAPGPTVGEDDLLICVVGTSINPVDWKNIKRAHALRESGHSIGRIALYVGSP